MARTRLTREDKRAANRGLILRAAREVFGRRGFHGATIEDIAAQAGLSNGAIYYNFTDKQDLFLALLDERIEERAHGVALALDSGKLGTQTLDAVRALRANRTWRLLFLEFVTYAARHPRFAKRLRAQRRKMRSALSDSLDRHFASRISRELPANELSIILIALVNGLAIQELTDPGSVPEDLLTKAAERLLAASAD